MLSVKAKYFETIDFYPTLEGEFQSDKNELIKRTKEAIEWYSSGATKPNTYDLINSLCICDIDAGTIEKEKLEDGEPNGEVRIS